MYRGILYMLLSSFCFALINICVKILADPKVDHMHLGRIFEDMQIYPVHELVFFRSLISLVICVSIVKARGIPFFGNNKKWLLIRGIAGATALTTFFFTIQNVPLAISTTVQYLSPIFTVLFAIYLQKEKVIPIQWLFIIISLSGVIVLGVTKDPHFDFEIGWLLLGLLSAVVAGIAYNAIMKCRNTDEPITIVMYFPLVAAPVMLMACIFIDFVTPRGIEWLLILAIGLLTQVAQVSMTRAFHVDSAARVTPVKYVGAIYAVTAGFFIFDEELGLYSSLGIMLVLLGVLLNTFVKQLKPNQAKLRS